MNPSTPMVSLSVAAPSDLTETSGRPWYGTKVGYDKLWGGQPWRGTKVGYDKLWGGGLERLFDKLLLGRGMPTFKMTIINKMNAIK
jgi:hypothetical protein